MYSAVLKEIEDLRSAKIAEIRVRYREVFGEEPRSKHREQLFRRLAWRLQAVAYGGLSERARQRAAEIANEADLRIRPPRDCNASQISAPRHDRRIPPAGTTLTRSFRNGTVSVRVLPAGFEYQGREYRSLSAIAGEVTGTRWNGLAFFGLNGKRVSGKGSRHAGKQ
jgi:hypothetical protein